MAGNSGEDNANPGNRREAPPEPPEAGSSPVLDGVSDAELDAIVGQLRTDRGLRVQPSAQQRSREAMQSERLHRGAGRTRASSLGEEPPQEAAPPARQAWYVVMGGAAYGPHEVPELKAHVERGALGPDSLCWREGFGEWLPLGHVPELAAALLPRTMPAGAPPLPVGVVGGVMPQGARPIDPSEATTERMILEPQPVSAHPPPERVAAPHAAVVPAAVSPLAAVPPAGSRASEPEGGHPADVSSCPATPQPEPVQADGAADVAPSEAAPGAPLAQGGLSDADFTAAAPVPDAVPQPAGTHAVLTSASAQRDERARRKRRLGILLAGGAVGGMSVALALAVWGPGTDRGTRASSAGGEPPQRAVPPAAAVEAPPADAVAQALPDAEVPARSPTESGGAGSRASSGPSGGGLAPSVEETARRSPPASVPEGAGASSPALSAVSVDRGGRVPELTGTESTSRAATGGTRASPEERVFERPTGSLSSRDVAVAFVIGKHSVAPAPEPAPAARPATTVAEAAVSPRSEDELGPDEDFDRVLSGPDPNAPRPQKRTVWVPPDPTAPRETLDLATVFAVVHSRRSELAACAREQSAPPREGDRAVLRLSVLPSGKVESITTETPWLRGTPLVRCMQQKIGGWTFPRHRTQGAPVVFRYEF